MKYNRNWLIILFCFLGTITNAQKIAGIDVELAESTRGLKIPVSLNLDAITFQADSLLSLVQIKNGSREEVPFQIEQGEERKLYWFVSNDSGDSQTLHFELESKKSNPIDEMKIKKDGETLVISSKDNHLLSYQYATMYPPAGVDSAFQRSGFIHPLWTPHGQVLTRVQPPDHYHHYGIWNPWTHVLFEGDTIDFWNLVKKEGTVRFAKFTSTESGSVFSEYDALHEHVVFKNESEKVALNEIQSVRVYQPQTNQDCFIVDLVMKYNCTTESPVTLLEYRYEGFGWRTTEKWDKNNSEVLSSQGKDRIGVDGSKERWAIVQGELDDDYGGVVMMSYPSNYNHPEPMRVWPINQYDRGDMFASFSTTKDTDWHLEPEKDYVLKYRLLVFNGKMTSEKAEVAWQYFAHPPKITVNK
mgnify:CR=1 FL=1